MEDSSAFHAQRLKLGDFVTLYPPLEQRDNLCHREGRKAGGLGIK